MRHIHNFWTASALVAATGLFIAAATVNVPAQDIGLPPNGESEAPPAREGGEEGYEALTRGPMHEAFAGPYLTNPEPGVRIDQQPPEPIEELPPEQMPEGENVVWIPGYWGLEPETEEFVWVSGLWRSVPPDRRWVPGYWSEEDGGWRWVSGFWASRETQELTYLPPPPRSLERGPNVAPPDGDYFWIPGCWIWQEVTYEWRPGYWAPAVADWVWIPDQYVWSPYGFVFVPGFWDLALLERGVLFSPVHFRAPVYRQPNFRYVPTIVVDTAPLLLHLFVGPVHHHYFYGDYYAFQPRGTAFYPWYEFDRRGSAYDPLLTYYQWSYARRDINLIERLSSWNQYFIRHEEFRPRHTFAEQRQFLAQVEGQDLAIQPTALAFAAPLEEFAESGRSFSFARIEEPRRQQFARTAQSIQEFQQRRREFEVSSVAEAGERATPDAQSSERGEGRQRQGQRRERSFQLPEQPALPETPSADRPGERTTPGEGRPTEQAGDQRRRGRQPPAPPRPDGRSAQPGRGRGPDQGRPGDQPATPDADRPSRPGTEPGRTDADRPDRPGAEQSQRPDETPQPGRPGTDRPRPGATPGERPDTPGEAQSDDGPRFPRFGTGRRGSESGRDTATDPSRPDLPGARQQPRPDTQRPGQGRDAAPGQDRTRRGGFDPFDRVPPATDAASGRDRPGAGRPQSNQPGPRPGLDRGRGSRSPGDPASPPGLRRTPEAGRPGGPGGRSQPGAEPGTQRSSPSESGRRPATPGQSGATPGRSPQQPSTPAAPSGGPSDGGSQQPTPPASPGEGSDGEENPNQ